MNKINIRVISLLAVILMVLSGILGYAIGHKKGLTSAILAMTTTASVKDMMNIRYLEKKDYTGLRLSLESSIDSSILVIDGLYSRGDSQEKRDAQKTLIALAQHRQMYPRVRDRRSGADSELIKIDHNIDLILKKSIPRNTNTDPK